MAPLHCVLAAAAPLRVLVSSFLQHHHDSILFLPFSFQPDVLHSSKRSPATGMVCGGLPSPSYQQKKPSSLEIEGGRQTCSLPFVSALKGQRTSAAEIFRARQSGFRSLNRSLTPPTPTILYVLVGKTDQLFISFDSLFSGLCCWANQAKMVTLVKHSIHSQKKERKIYGKGGDLNSRWVG